MKKLLRIFATLLIFIFVFAAVGCKPESVIDNNPSGSSGTSGTEKEKITIYVPDGAPALSMVKYMQSGATLGGKDVEVVVSTGDVVKAKLLSGEADIAILPVSAGAKLYNMGNDIKLAAVTVWGLNYLVGKTEITSLDDLKGKIVHSIGKGDTPDIMFRKILTSKGIDFVESDTALEGKIAIKYYSAGSDIVPLLKTDKAEFAILGEPVVSKTKAPAIGCIELMNLQTEWESITNGVPVTQAGVILGKSVYNDTALVNELISTLKETDTFIKSYPETTGEILADHNSAVAATTTFTTALITRCNIKTERASEKLDALTNYFNELKNFGSLPALPGSDFYL